MASSIELQATHGWTSVVRDPTLLLSGKPYIHKPEPLLVEDIAFPTDDALVAQVQDYAKDRLSPQTYSHSMRVYYFGTTAPSN